MATRAKSKPAPALDEGRIDYFFSMPAARADNWRELMGTARSWAEERATRADVEAAFNRVRLLEQFHAYPGARLMAALSERIQSGAAAGAADLARRISGSIVTRAYKHDPAEWEVAEQVADTPPELQSSTMSPGERRRPYFEMLLVAPGARTRGEYQIAELRRLRRPEDDFIYEGVPVASFEDAFVAAIVNPAIAAVTICEGFGYSSRHDAPVLRSVLASFGIDKAHVVGLSMGAYTALQACVKYPERVTSMVFCGGGSGGTHDDREKIE